MKIKMLREMIRGAGMIRSIGARIGVRRKYKGKARSVGHAKYLFVIKLS
jgi:hypothetical protein